MIQGTAPDVAEPAARYLLIPFPVYAVVCYDQGVRADATLYVPENVCVYETVCSSHLVYLCDCWRKTLLNKVNKSLGLACMHILRD